MHKQAPGMIPLCGRHVRLKLHHTAISCSVACRVGANALFLPANALSLFDNRPCHSAFRLRQRATNRAGWWSRPGLPVCLRRHRADWRCRRIISRFDRTLLWKITPGFLHAYGRADFRWSSYARASATNSCRRSPAQDARHESLVRREEGRSKRPGFFWAVTPPCHPHLAVSDLPAFVSARPTLSLLRFQFH